MLCAFTARGALAAGYLRSRSQFTRAAIHPHRTEARMAVLSSDRRSAPRASYQRRAGVVKRKMSARRADPSTERLLSLR